MIASSPEAMRAVRADGAAWAAWDSADGPMPLGLFRGMRAFEVPLDGMGGTALHFHEEYPGPLLGLIWRSMPDLVPSSGRSARGIKRRLETGR
jgi:hypothetical protein